MKPDLSRAQWRKSSYSGNSGNCVEVAIFNKTIFVRDSENPGGTLLSFTADRWLEFMAKTKACGGSLL